MFAIHLTLEFFKCAYVKLNGIRDPTYVQLNGTRDQNNKNTVINNKPLIEHYLIKHAKVAN